MASSSSSGLLLGLVVLGVFSCGALAIAACSDSSEPAASSPDASSSTDGSTKTDGSSSGGVDAGASDDAAGKTTCEITRKYFVDCDNEGDLNCGAAKFDAWCTQSDKAINSVAYRNAEALCLNKDNCDGKKRRDCEYTHYNSEVPTSSEAALTAAYCQTCEPSDISGCTLRATKYDPNKGINSVGDIFVAVWELTDALCDDIKTKCTGSALAFDAGADAGTGAGACAKAFGGCSADIYLAAVPDCPK